MLDLSHKKLDTWKFSIELVKLIYLKTEKFPKTEVYGLTNQMRRASVSIASNIAEGASRNSKLERKRFFEISRSSLVELDTQIEISVQLNFLFKEDADGLEKLCETLFKMISGLITSTEK